MDEHKSPSNYDRFTSLLNGMRRRWAGSALIGLFTLLSVWSGHAKNTIDTVDKFLKARSWFQSDDSKKAYTQPLQNDAPTADRSEIVVCIKAETIGEAYEIVGPPPIGAKRKMVETDVRGRSICGRGWPAFYKQTATTGGRRIVIVSDRQNRKLQLQTNDDVWQFTENDPVWIKEGVFDELNDDEVLVGHSAIILKREPVARPTKTSRDNKQFPEIKRSGDHEPTLSIFEFDWWRTWPANPPKAPDELRDKYMRD